MISKTSHADASLTSTLDPSTVENVSRVSGNKPIAVRMILDHAAPCWHCSKRLQACNADGSTTGIGKYGCSPNYKGSAMAYVAEIDGHQRRMHRTCAEELGYRCVAEKED